MRQERPQGWSKGLSVACGEGRKEMSLVSAGIVEHFDLFEISAARVERGRALAEKKGIADKLTFHVCDAFSTDVGQYDIVYWNNALHHMLDTTEAVAWSHERLVRGGSFVMDDYVGRNRLQ